MRRTQLRARPYGGAQGAEGRGERHLRRTDREAEGEAPRVLFPSTGWLALALKTAESAFIGLSWRNILRAAYPRSFLSFKTAWAASQGGTAINAVAPAQAGTVAMIGIFRTSIPGSSVAGVAAATAAQALFFTAGAPDDADWRGGSPPERGLEGLALGRDRRASSRRTPS